MNQEERSRSFTEAADFPAIRSDVVTARQTIRRAIAGDDADLETAAGLLDQVLEGLCPHDPASRFESYADTGELLVTCTACGVSWYTGRRYGEGQS